MADFELNGTVATAVQVADQNIGWALLGRARKLSGGVDDDAGMDWLTDTQGNTYIGSGDWLVSSNPEVAALVDAGNILCAHGIMRIDPKKPKQEL